ncbi:aldose 1-epimerase [Euzebya sp.]|uniref:aldose 1-epimerase n=1 Tax=Euzebya sp. TaxID=1971409 RepID=UPI0035141C2F
MDVTLSAGGDRVVVDARGRMTSFVAGGVERLLTAPPRPEDPAADYQWGSFVMAPFAGRIADGVLDVGGTPVQLERRLGDHAIHGLVMDRPWEVAAQDGTAATLTCEVDGPLACRVTQVLRLAPGELALELGVTAHVDDLPAWVGWHPCFRRDLGEVAVRVVADHVVVVDERSLPTGERVPVAGDTDLRDGPVVGDRLLDHPYVDVRGPAVVRWPDLELEMAFPPPLSSAVVFTQPGVVCVEPQSAWPDAARLAAAGHDTGVVTLARGESLTAQTTWRWAAR